MKDRIEVKLVLRVKGGERERRKRKGFFISRERVAGDGGIITGGRSQLDLC